MKRVSFDENQFRNPGYRYYLYGRMKKLLLSLTVLVYLFMSCGVIINLHYCMGNYHSFDIYSNAKDECGTCGMKMDKPHSCCKDEVKILKIHDDQNFTPANYSVKNVQAPVTNPSSFSASSIIPSDHFFNEADLIPPELSGQGIYLQHCVFRI